MGWFHKDEKKQGGNSLPELPRLPELPEMKNSNFKSGPIPQLPSYPSSPYGEKFSHDAIKDAVSGEEEEESEDFGMNEPYEMEENDEENDAEPPMQKPPTQKRRMELEDYRMPVERSRPEMSDEAVHRNGKNEPVFVRMDKFEEGLKIFEETKEKVMEVEKMLEGIRRIKDEEEKELQEWESEIQNIKSQFEKIDRDIFSKVY